MLQSRVFKALLGTTLLLGMACKPAASGSEQKSAGPATEQKSAGSASEQLMRRYASELAAGTKLVVKGCDERAIPPSCLLEGEAFDVIQLQRGLKLSVDAK